MKTHSGLFWTPVPKEIKTKSTPPEPFWLEPGYIPPYTPTQVEMMTEAEIRQAAKNKEVLICDIELYPNYFMAAFMSLESGKCIIVEENMEQLKWLLYNFQIVTFNGSHFDVPIMTLAIAGKSIEELKYATDMLILHGVKGWQLLKSFGIEQLKIDHIDIIEVCPLKASLKIYGGRLNVPRMQDLPFPPDTNLTTEQIEILKNYCVNDLTTTAFVFMALEEQLSVRKEMSDKYRIDLRSKSDAQIAEAVFKVELKRMGTEGRKSDIEPGTTFRYRLPTFLEFRTTQMQELAADIQKARFVVTDKGSLFIPDELVEPSCRKHKDGKKRKGRTVKVGNNNYRLGIGGLHSCEENVAFHSDETFVVIDRDVASYYPALILNQNLYPKHLGMNFLNVYRSLVSRRLKAKREKNKIEADMLKIVINGTFGKLGSRYSIFYSPDLLIQTTITGQLSLLMLIEMLDEKGIQVCSANTDGIVVRYPRALKETVDEIFTAWEKQTNFETEETVYKSLYINNVNNYISIKPSDEAKLKGAYSIGEGIFRFHKNPTNPICVDAAVAYLTKGTPVRDTIRSCKDLTKFLTVRTVKGGAVKLNHRAIKLPKPEELLKLAGFYPFEGGTYLKEGHSDRSAVSKDHAIAVATRDFRNKNATGNYLGKAIRWYMSNNTAGDIVYASNGNKVPKSENAQPCMDLPDEFPDDIDYTRYEVETLEMLKQIAAI